MDQRNDPVRWEGQSRMVFSDVETHVASESPNGISIKSHVRWAVKNRTVFGDVENECGCRKESPYGIASRSPELLR